MPLEKDVLTTGEVAKICNVAPRTVSKWFDSGQLKGYRIPGSKDRRIPLAQLIRFMKDHNIPMDGLMTGATRLLIVDDDDAVTSALNKHLAEQTTYEIHVASDAFEAGIVCRHVKPHVMPLDIHLVDADPGRVIRLLRDNDELTITRVVAMSGKLTDGQAAHLRRLGYDGFLRKPFQLRQVVEAIERANSLVH
ncbi:MAG: response regulator [Planctomycetota bacterium]|nr:MAG: response regulator [Planctomycetota bacterium]